MTPEIKSLLRKKNKLMQRGKIEKTEAIGRRVAKAIHKVTSEIMKGVDLKIGNKAPREAVKKFTKVTRKQANLN